MINKIKIENYKGLKKINLSSLTRVNLVGGCNNVGKTSLLEAVFNFYDQLAPDIFIRQYGWRGVPSIAVRQTNMHELWLPVFNNYDIEKLIRIIITDEKLNDKEFTAKIEKESTSVLPKSNFLSIPQTVSGGTDSISDYVLHIKVHSSQEKVFEKYTKMNDSGFQSEIKINKLSLPQAHFFNQKTLSSKDDAVRYGELIKDGKEKLLVDALQKFEPKITSVTPIPLQDMNTILYADIGISKKIPLNYLGDGTSKLVSYILAILSTKGGILLIDEIENGYHYTKQKLIWNTLFNLAQENDVQIIATTHSYEMARAFNEYCLENKLESSYFELFTNPKTENVMVNHLDSETLNIKIRSNKPFRGE